MGNSHESGRHGGVGFCDTPGQAKGVAVSGNYAYVADWDHGLRVVNISNPAAPAKRWAFMTRRGMLMMWRRRGVSRTWRTGGILGIYDCSAATGISDQSVSQPMTEHGG